MSATASYDAIAATKSPPMLHHHLHSSPETCHWGFFDASLKPVLTVASGDEVTIADIAKLVAEVIGYRGHLVFDASRPDGTPRKLLDSSKLIKMGWRPRTPLRRGIELTYSEFAAGKNRMQ